jgi:hypothetical protein
VRERADPAGSSRLWAFSKLSRDPRRYNSANIIESIGIGKQEFGGSNFSAAAPKSSGEDARKFCPRIRFLSSILRRPAPERRETLGQAVGSAKGGEIEGETFEK